MSEEEARGQSAISPGTPSVGGLILEFLGAVSSRSKTEVSRAQSQGRLALERRSLQQDRQNMLAKLGREAIALLNGGEVDHPGLQRGAERIRALDAQIDALGTDPASE
jgi:hypothetical protein